MPTSDQFAAAELARLCAAKGIRHAVISPGSRSAPLVIAFSKQEGIECLQVIDERSAAFFALGMAQQLHAPVALICTSGSAVLNYGPAIAEAFYQRIPMLVITADRPEEWVDQGEGTGDPATERAGLAHEAKRAIATDARAMILPAMALWSTDQRSHRCHFAPRSRSGACERAIRGAALWNITEVDRTSRFIAPVMTESFILPEHARWLIGQLSACKKVMVLAGQGCVERRLA
jgi:2-succinyl-5-enolpyruvyl-6-hydroxy-3-cyclohexene-1-carboxylate synthase